jgi:hypothetical protein
MELISIYNKGHNLSISLNELNYTNLNTITNTVTIQKTKSSATVNSFFDTAITIKKEISQQLDVNNKK